MTSPRRPTSPTRALLQGAHDTLPWHDDRDFDDVQRGLVESPAGLVVRTESGRVVWDTTEFADQTLQAPCPDTVHPSLWRQARLNNRHGLFEVVPGIYQVRGFDISNMTLIERGDREVVVVDPLVSCEMAAAAFALYAKHRGPRRITAVIYTHSHVDHFGGVEGIVTPAQVAAGEVEVWAPDGFLEAAIDENVLAGPAMGRRSRYMYGSDLPRGPEGMVDVGLGKATSKGRISLIPPTHHITDEVQDARVGGVRMVFQLTPGTEAPAEMNFLVADRHALCMAENANHVLHNILTIRGAVVRDALAWSDYLGAAVRLFVDDVDVSFAQHHWPTWGRDNVRDYLETQRDLYRYVHDQTVRAMNQGRTGIEIAEDFVLPPELDQAWHARGYYGSISHNVKAVYQRYLGWYDGNPARLHRLPPEEGGRRYVAAMGGPDAVVALARRAAGDGDERWAAELLDHVVFGHPDHDEARTLQADVLEQLGYRQENATWRNAYLMGAKELRTPIPAWPLPGGGFLSAMETRQLWNVLAARLDGPASFGRTATVTWVLPDRGEQWTLRLRRGVLVHDPVADPGADATVTIDRADLDRVFANQATVADLLAAGRITITGTADAVVGMLGLLRPPDVNFAIITP